MLIHVHHQIINTDHIQLAFWVNKAPANSKKPEWNLSLIVAADQIPIILSKAEALAVWNLLKGIAERTNCSSEPSAEEVLA